MQRGTRSSVLTAFGSSLVVLGALVVACTDNGTDASPQNDAGPSGSTRDSSSSTPDPRRDGAVTEVSQEPGSPCSKVGEIYARACGNCGKEYASCSPSKVVTGYGSCSDEPQGACTPGKSETNSTCGYCGTGSRTCNDECKWVDQACSGEVTGPNRCKAGERVDREEGCTGGVTRPWTCSDTCTWITPSVSCEEAGGVLVIGTEVGNETSLDTKEREDTILRIVNSSKAPCEISKFTNSKYTYVEVRNPNATDALVELTVGASGGDLKPMLVLAAYATEPDASAVSRKACLNGATTSCTGEPALSACLKGDKAITIPASGSVFAYVGNFNDYDPAFRFKLRAKIVEP